MKKNLLFLCLLLLAAGCATQKNFISDPSPKARGVAPPVYYDGNDEPAVPGIFLYSEEQQKTN
jgi:hypothetical protein